MPGAQQNRETASEWDEIGKLYFECPLTTLLRHKTPQECQAGGYFCAVVAEHGDKFLVGDLFEVGQQLEPIDIAVAQRHGGDFAGADVAASWAWAWAKRVPNVRTASYGLKPASTRFAGLKLTARLPASKRSRY